MLDHHDLFSMSESFQELLDSDMHLAWLVVLCKRNSVLLLTISFIWPILFPKLDVIVRISVVRRVLYVHHQQLLQRTSLPKLLVGFSPSLAVIFFFFYLFIFFYFFHFFFFLLKKKFGSYDYAPCHIRVTSFYFSKVIVLILLSLFHIFFV